MRWWWIGIFVVNILGGKEMDVVKMVEEIVLPVMHEKNIPGIAVAVYFEGKEYLVNLGFADRETRKPVTPDTIFELASISKVFTSTLLALEVQAGRMRLNDPVTKYLPLIKKKNIPLERVTLQSLATHTSSLARMSPPKIQTPEALMRYYETWTPSWPIGTRYLYSNSGFGLLGMAIGGANQTSFEEVLRIALLNPLGMGRTFVHVPSELKGAFAQGYSSVGKPLPPTVFKPWGAGGGALKSTSKDMLAFLEANLGVKGPQPLLSAMQLAQQGIFKVSDKLTLGLGWQRFQDQGRLIVDKNGGVDGFSTYIGMTGKSGVVLLANKGKGEMTALGRKLLLRLVK
jgi:beta-lactamase class C